MRIALRPRSRSSRGEFPASMANLLGNFMADSTYEQAKRSLTSSSMSLVAKVSDIASAESPGMARASVTEGWPWHAGQMEPPPRLLGIPACLI